MEPDREYFESLVADALDELPEEFAKRMENVAVVVEEEPEGPLLGLYQGTPLTERTSAYGNVLPDRVLIFQGPHERSAEDEEDLVVAIGETLIHEIGHYFGLSEEEIEEIEERYWNAEVDEADD